MEEWWQELAETKANEDGCSETKTKEDDCNVCRHIRQHPISMIVCRSTLLDTVLISLHFR